MASFYQFRVEGMDLIELAQNSGAQTLVNLIKQAGLTNTIKHGGKCICQNVIFIIRIKNNYANNWKLPSGCWNSPLCLDFNTVTQNIPVN